jgi:AcrR family transcriptional regulator
MSGPGEETRPKVRRILDAAASVFARRGFDQARMDDVAGEAGVSKGGLYLHFKSKEELFDALVGYVVGLETRKLARAREAQGSVEERLVGFFHEYAQDMVAMEKFLPIIMEVYARATRSATIRRMVQRYVDALVADLSPLIAEGVEKGEFRKVDPDEVAIQLISLLEGLALLWGLQPDFKRMPELADGGVRLLLDGLVARPRPQLEAPGGEM